jgi:hypothetical protein
LTNAVPIMAALLTSSQVELRRAAADGSDDASTRADFGRQEAQFLGQWRDWPRTHVR